MPGEIAARHLGAAAWTGHEAGDARYVWPHLFSRITEVLETRSSHGPTRAHLVAIAKKNFANAKRNPFAQTRGWTFGASAFENDDAANSVVTGRVRRQDCGQVTDGAAAIVPASAAFAEVHAKRTGRALATFPRLLGWGRRTSMHEMKTRRHRWRFDLVTGATREEALDDECSEFPTIHSGYAGKKHRYVYAAVGEPGLFLFNGLVRTDVETGAKSTYAFPKGVFASEAPFCPRDGATAEDDGYLVTFTTDMNADASECQIFDARALERGPVARVRLPMRISSGTHATWSPRTRAHRSAPTL